MKALETNLSVFGEFTNSNEIVKKFFAVLNSSEKHKSYIEQALELINERKVG